MPDGLTAGDVFARAAFILADEGYTRWTVPEMLYWLNDAQREIAVHNPAASSAPIEITLARGTRQALPDAVASILDVDCNRVTVGEDTLDGRAVRRAERKLFDEHHPDWQIDTFMPYSVEAQYLLDDPLDHRGFLVAPGNTGTGKIRILAAVRPAAVPPANPNPALQASYTSAALSVDPIYHNAIVDYVVFRCLNKDIAVPGTAERAQAHYAAFAQAIGLKQASESTMNPDTRRET